MYIRKNVVTGYSVSSKTQSFASPQADMHGLYYEGRGSVKESRGQPKSDALKQVTCKGNF